MRHQHQGSGHASSIPAWLCVSASSPQAASVASVTVWPEYLAETANAEVLLQDTLWRAGLGGLASPLRILAGGSHLPHTASPCEPFKFLGTLPVSACPASSLPSAGSETLHPKPAFQGFESGIFPQNCRLCLAVVRIGRPRGEQVKQLGDAVMMTPLTKSWTSKGGAGTQMRGRVQRLSREERWKHPGGDQETKSVGKVLFPKQQREKGMVANSVEGCPGEEGRVLRGD